MGRHGSGYTAASMDEALAVAEEDRLRARREERYARAALDRALDELEGLRAELQAGGAALHGAGDGAPAMLGLDSSGGQRDLVLRRAVERAESERRARLDLEQSLSWRITRPLRLAKAALVGQRHRLRALASAGGQGPAR